MGDYIMKRTADWREKHKIVGEVRGKGLMIGIELVRDQKTKEKATDLRNKLVQMAFHKGLLVLGSGDTTLRLCPPLSDRRSASRFRAQTRSSRASPNSSAACRQREKSRRDAGVTEVHPWR